MPASAEQRTLLATLVGGAQVTVTVDVPPGTPTDQIPIPGVSAPILSVQDITPAQPAPAPEPTQPPVQVTVDPNGGQSGSSQAPAATRAPRRTTRPSRRPSRSPASRPSR
jgi:cytoskeletal protein RodZ